MIRLKPEADGRTLDRGESSRLDAAVIICQMHFIGAEKQEYGGRRILFYRRFLSNHHSLTDHLGNLE